MLLLTPFSKWLLIRSYVQKMWVVMTAVDRIVNTPFNVQMNKDKKCEIVCDKKKLSKAESKLFAERIQEEYYVHLWVFLIHSPCKQDDDTPLHYNNSIVDLKHIFCNTPSRFAASGHDVSSVRHNPGTWRCFPLLKPNPNAILSSFRIADNLPVATRLEVYLNREAGGEEELKKDMMRDVQFEHGYRLGFVDNNKVGNICFSDCRGLLLSTVWLVWTCFV